MQSEALRNVRTMRQVKTSLDLANNQRVKTTNSLSRTDGEVAYLKSLADGQVGQILSGENKRFAAMESAIDKSRQRLLRAREKLAATINKNRALTELRHELQRSRFEGKNPVPLKAEIPTRKPKLHQVELKY
jgi:hypothetical protein